MTDTTTTEEPQAPTTVAESEGGDVASPPPAPPAKVPFWDRPHVERFLTPLVLPVAVVIGLVTYVINISRIFLSGHGHIPIFVSTAITILILLGATLLSAASPHLRQSSITLISAGFILSIMSAGWLVLGSAQPKETGPETLPATLKTKQSFDIVAAAGGAFSFNPNSIDAKTGLVKFVVTVGSPGHTFAFEDPSTKLGLLKLDVGGAKVPGVAYFAEAGDYAFLCTITGHAAQGMHGVVHVTGSTVSLEQAVVEGGNPAGAENGG
jgi:plastocyanin